MIRGRGPRDGCGEGQGQVLLKYRLSEFRDGTVDMDITKLIIFVYVKLLLLRRISRREMTKVSMKGTPAPKMTMRFN